MLVLVMTLLGVLFVTGIAFLATMDFEADMVAAQQQRDRNELGISSVVDDVGTILRAGLMAEPGVPFGSQPIGTTTGGFAELPGVQNLFAPIEPYEDATTGQYVFRWFTDVRSLRKGPHDGLWLRELNTFEVLATGEAVLGIDTNWQAGAPVILDAATPGILTLDTNGDGAKDAVLPVDADGDGIADTLAFPLSDFPLDPPSGLQSTGLGFSGAQIAAISSQLNGASNPDGEVYLGLRIVAHGGMVNLNESHPNLIANVLGLEVANLFGCGAVPENGFFRHRPTCEQETYSPMLEESILRHRGLLLPRTITPSLLFGNPLLDLDDRGRRSGAPGGADMWRQFFPPDPNDLRVFETVYEGDHRYTPFMPGEPYPPEPAEQLWAVRMEPFTSFNVDPNGEAYDRRHLVTTVSYDALLSRGGVAEGVDENGELVERDLRDWMLEANRAIPPGVDCTFPLPFEYADYPQDMLNQTVPNLEGDQCTEFDSCRDFCRPDVRKGRLLLSLAWLDEMDEMIERGWDKRLRDRLLHDVFFLLVRNAHGPYWDRDVQCTTNNECNVGANEFCDRRCVGGDYDGQLCTVAGDCPNGTCPPRGVCADMTTGMSRRESLISRTAASLTANLLDYMDADFECVGGSADGYACVDNTSCPGRSTCEPARECQGGDNHGVRCEDDNDCPNGICFSLANPTRIALRSFDFADKTCVDRATGVGTDISCTTEDDCPQSGCPDCDCLTTAGWEFGSERLPNDPQQYVYGLERQPFITEVATESAAPGGQGTEQVIARGVELFNPYTETIDWDGDGDGAADYWLIEDDPAVPGPFQNFIPLGQPFANGAFTAYVDGNFSPRVGPTRFGTIYPAPAAGFEFENGWIIYLVRRVIYQRGARPTWIVVDQMAVEGINIGLPNPPGGLGVHSLQRVVVDGDPWTATVPAAGEDPLGPGTPDTLGNWNDYVAPVPVRPVEVNFANTGSFTRLHPLDVDDDPTNDVGLGVAFPTTGSLLLLMRHANRSLDDYAQTTDLAFTTWLDDVTTVAGVPVPESAQIDNGRMPVFDIGGAHHKDPADTPPNTPGGLENLPWGQLVFDYFTALPLRSVGPYENPDPNNVNWMPGAPDSIPRVDLNGLRVHGRININAAPWTVLSGLPFTPMQRIPQAFRGKVRFGLALVNDDPASAPPDPRATEMPSPVDNLLVLDDAAATIGNELAQAIVAYREARVIEPDVGGVIETTGNYGDVAGGRGWNLGTPTAPMPPAARRGTGLVSIGELANVRNPNATMFPYFATVASPYRMDGGALERRPPALATDQRDFVEAVAALVALGDWVTVRSDVFTVYGTLRGDPLAGQAAAEVDSRAIRFRETIDRLPTFLGEPMPVRIGERVIGKYTNIRND